MPLLIVYFNFYVIEAIPISKSIIFTASFTSYILSFRREHPSGIGSIVDYNVALLVCPMVILGTVIGVALNLNIPEIYIKLTITIILLANTLKTVRKSIFKKEDYLSERRNWQETLLPQTNQPIWPTAQALALKRR